MIICHPLKIIFLKTYKTSSSSFENALSHWCTDKCIVTDRIKDDEKNIYMKKYNLKGYQNAQPPLKVLSNHLKGHTRSAQIKELIDKMYGVNIEINWWQKYTKIAIHRNPFERFISWYCHRGNDEPFEVWARKNLDFLDKNHEVAPLKDMDYIIRYEYLKEDIEKLNIDNLWELYSNIKINSNFRPKDATVEKMYKGQKELVNLIIDKCKHEIKYFKYDIPEV